MFDIIYIIVYILPKLTAMDKNSEYNPVVDYSYHQCLSLSSPVNSLNFRQQF